MLVTAQNLRGHHGPPRKMFPMTCGARIRNFASWSTTASCPRSQRGWELRCWVLGWVTKKLWGWGKASFFWGLRGLKLRSWFYDVFWCLMRLGTAVRYYNSYINLLWLTVCCSMSYVFCPGSYMGWIWLDEFGVQPKPQFWTACGTAAFYHVSNSNAKVSWWSDREIYHIEPLQCSWWECIIQNHSAISAPHLALQGIQATWLGYYICLRLLGGFTTWNLNMCMFRFHPDDCVYTGSYFWCGFINGTPPNPTLYR